MTVVSLFGSGVARRPRRRERRRRLRLRPQRRRRDRHQRARRHHRRGAGPARGAQGLRRVRRRQPGRGGGPRLRPGGRRRAAQGRPGGPDAAAAAARATPTTVEVGTPVAAIGSPFAERQSLSVGVVSAVDRSITGLTAFQIAGAIQTDAAINPGNSGGPLVDADGEVIGINQQIKTSSGGGEGVGFAVPIDVAKRSLEQLRERRRGRATPTSASRPCAIYPQLRERFDLPVGEGAWVQDVAADGPADEGRPARRRRRRDRVPGPQRTAPAAT